MIYAGESELIVEYAQVTTNVQRNKYDQVYLCSMASTNRRSAYKAAAH